VLTANTDTGEVISLAGIFLVRRAVATAGSDQWRV